MYRLFRESEKAPQILFRKSSLKHIMEDMSVSDLVVCGRHILAKVIRRIKEQMEVQV